MNVVIAVAAGLVGIALVIVLASYVVEALRSAPPVPVRLAWAPDVTIEYVTIEGTTLRYVTAGGGRPLVLLHTLRTQLDMFQKVIPALATRARVYALDYPGHGWSDVPAAESTRELFVTAVAGFLDQLDIRDATLVGESIGGTIALLLAARGNPRVRRVVAVNVYDYAAGSGIRRGSPFANLLYVTNDVPVLGATVERLRTYPIARNVLMGGVCRKGAFPSELLRELYEVGNRRGQYRAFMSLVHHLPEWEQARAEYGRVGVPALLLYGDRDWSRLDEREADRRDIPGVELRTVEDAGHFVSLDAPDELVRAVVEFDARSG
jgi:pimeloyl-ACP methyl ester carboxylesterase